MAKLLPISSVISLDPDAVVAVYLDNDDYVRVVFRDSPQTLAVGAGEDQYQDILAAINTNRDAGE